MCQIFVYICCAYVKYTYILYVFNIFIFVMCEIYILNEIYIYMYESCM